MCALIRTPMRHKHYNNTAITIRMMIIVTVTITVMMVTMIFSTHICNAQTSGRFQHRLDSEHGSQRRRGRHGVENPRSCILLRVQVSTSATDIPDASTTRTFTTAHLSCHRTDLH